MKDQLKELINKWHEAGRNCFESSITKINYDKLLPKAIIEKKKYFYLDEGTSGVFMVDKKTGDIYRIKAYGRINRQKFCGNITNVTGERILSLRWW